MEKMEFMPVPFTCGAINEAIEVVEYAEINSYDKCLIVDLLEKLRADNEEMRAMYNDLIMDLNAKNIII